MSKSLIGDPDDTWPIPQLPDEESDMLTGTASEYTVCQPTRPATEDGRVLFTALEVIGALRDVGVAISLRDIEAVYKRLSGPGV